MEKWKINFLCVYTVYQGPAHPNVIINNNSGACTSQPKDQLEVEEEEKELKAKELWEDKANCGNLKEKESLGGEEERKSERQEGERGVPSFNW